jgi:ABC-type Fe3+-hydroxamate transport system substrate-binding protein
MYVCVLTAVFSLLLPRVLQALSPPCSRIISLAPSLTELVQVLTLDEHLVGVSSFDDTLKDRLPVVGNLYAVNVEAIVSLRPSLVLLLAEQKRFADQLAALTIPVLSVDHSSVTAIRESLIQLGKKCDRQSTTERYLQEMDARMTALKKIVRSESVRLQSTVRALVVVGNPLESSEGIGQLHVSGSDGYYAEILDNLGVPTAYEGPTRGVSAFSLEGFIALKPTHIFHIFSPQMSPPSLSELRRRWKDEFPMIPAVRGGAVGGSSEKFFSIPGIHYPKVAEAFAEFFIGYEGRDDTLGK